MPSGPADPLGASPAAGAAPAGSAPRGAPQAGTLAARATPEAAQPPSPAPAGAPQAGTPVARTTPEAAQPPSPVPAAVTAPPSRRAVAPGPSPSPQVRLSGAGVSPPVPSAVAPGTAALATALSTALDGSGARQSSGSRTGESSPATVARPTVAAAAGLEAVQAAPVLGASGSGPQPAAAPTVPGAGVQMQDMIESIHATIEMATRQGISQARISLEPAELGAIRIHLSQTDGGLLARVTAETPAAAQALAAGRGELHQALSSLGTSLLRLDIGSFGAFQGRGGGQAETATGGTRRGGTTGGGESIEAADGPEAGSAAAPRALGELVDVLA